MFKGGTEPAGISRHNHTGPETGELMALAKTGGATWIPSLFTLTHRSSVC